MNEQIGNKINDKTYIKLTPFKGFVLENFPFIEADFDAITNYQLLCKVIEYLNNVIANQNTVQELGTDLVNAYNSLVDAVNLAINEFETDVTADINQFKVDINDDFDEFTSNITTQFNDLKDYVDNFFDNNFPQMISDKLDEMAEDGTLENLLNDAAHLTKSYNTYTDMMSDSSAFTNGLRLRTLGYYTINDGGGAEYYVNNSVIDNQYQVELGNDLYLNIIVDDYINVKQLGAYGNLLNDDTNIIQTALNNYKNVFIPKGIYNITQLSINTHQHLFGIGRESYLYSTSDNTNNDIFAIDVPLNADHVVIEKLRINGGIQNGVTGTASVQDLNNTFKELTIQYGYGFKLNHRGNYLNNVRVGNTKYGFDIIGTDNIIESCVSSTSDNHGFNISGANNGVFNCKAFISGNTEWGAGFCITGAFERVSGCEAQQNRYENFWLQNSYGSQLTDCISDGAFWEKANIESYNSPAFSTSIYTSAIFIHNIDSCNINVTNINGSIFTTPAATTEVIGCKYPNTIHKSSLNVNSYNRNNYVNEMCKDVNLYRFIANNIINANGISYNNYVNGLNTSYSLYVDFSASTQETKRIEKLIPTDTRYIAFCPINYDATVLDDLHYDITITGMKNGVQSTDQTAWLYFVENGNTFYDIGTFIDSKEFDSISEIKMRYFIRNKTEQDAFTWTLGNLRICTSNSYINTNL